jgi:hypothetical protein
MMRTLMAVTILVCLLGSTAQARSHHNHSRHHYYRHHHHHQLRQYRHVYQHRADGQYYHYVGRPRAWCGWYMRSQVGSDPGPSYNLARSWAHYGSKVVGPTIGAIVVWRHHVGKIVGHENGQWIVESGNDGHAVRTRPRSLTGAIAFRQAYGAF